MARPVRLRTLIAYYTINGMRGGKRVGAGRRPLVGDVPLQRLTVSLPAEYVTWARDEGAGNVSEGLRRLLEELDQRQGADVALLGQKQP